jgi:hypothetical protein
MKYHGPNHGFSVVPLPTVHLLAAQHALHYLATMKHQRLIYGRNDSMELIGYSDLDWAGDKDDCRSTSAYVFIISGGTIAWATQKQRTVTLSSTEAEYMALTECLKHTQWTIAVLQQLSFDVDLPIDIFSDSLGARSITSNNVYHTRTKHIDIKYHYIREKIANATINVNEVNTKNDLADICTKALPREQHNFLADRLGLIDIPIEGDC